MKSIAFTFRDSQGELTIIASALVIARAVLRLGGLDPHLPCIRQLTVGQEAPAWETRPLGRALVQAVKPWC